MIRFLAGAVVIGLASAASAWAQTEACPGGPPGWIAAQGSGCRLWNACPQREDTVTWSGACPNGVAEGRGITQWFQGGKPNDRFEGTLRDGQRTGRGVFTWANGNRYDGEWRDNERNGRGVFSTAAGDRYDGEWRDGMPNGRGAGTWVSGNRYDGEWRDGKRSGRGAYTFADGDRYEGEWRDGRPNGRGKGTYRDGSVYEGTWTNGCFQQGNRRWALFATDAECGFR